MPLANTTRFRDRIAYCRFAHYPYVTWINERVRLDRIFGRRGSAAAQVVLAAAATLTGLAFIMSLILRWCCGVAWLTFGALSLR